MIDRPEVEAMAGEMDVHTSHVQRDYVHGWLLSDFFSNSGLADRVVLKGGNGLRKAYFPTGRFSRDIDLSTTDGVDLDELKVELNACCERVSTATGIEFDLESTLIADKRGADGEKKLSEARLYFRDFYGVQSQLVLSIRLDVAQFDRLYLPVQLRNLIHPYSDSADCSRPIRVAKLEEILASKMRCLLQRKHIADLYDLAFPLLRAAELEIDRSELLSTFFRITVFGASPRVAKGLLLDLPLHGLKQFWSKYVSAPVLSRFSFDQASETIRELIESLLPGDAIRERSSVLFPAALRNPILAAADGPTLLSLRYDGVDRLVEPYSMTFKTRKDGIAREYLYAFDRTGGRSSGPGIKTFLPDRIQRLENTEETFEPQFEVELRKAGGSETAGVFEGRPGLRGRRSSRLAEARYYIECPVCSRRFPRKTRSRKLRPHKDQYGNRCYGKNGHFV